LFDSRDFLFSSRSLRITSIALKQIRCKAIPDLHLVATDEKAMVDVQKGIERPVPSKRTLPSCWTMDFRTNGRWSLALQWSGRHGSQFSI
jgi:hypothetical protein